MAKRKKETTEFGEYLVELIEEAQMFKSDFYLAVGINKPYFYEMLSSNAPPPDTLETMIEVIEARLGEDECRRHKLYDLAARCRQEIPADINEWIIKHPGDWENIRTALFNLSTES